MRSIASVVVVAACAALVAVVGCSPSEDTYRQDVVDLTGQPPEVAYVALNCAKCHGADRQGQRTAPAIDDLTRRWNEDSLVAYLRDPKAVQAATPRLAYLAEKYPIEMPAYAHTDEDVLRHLIGWLLAD